jgi:nucleoside phosphorylase
VLVIAATEPELVGVEGLVCGIGPVEAAAATARALAERKPVAVLHVGLAGAHGFAEPELVVGSEAIYCDADGSRLVHSSIQPDRELLTRTRAALTHARVAPIGTSARVGGTTGCEIEAMEGFAVLRACELAGIPAIELRAVVNEIAEPDRARWHFAEGLALLRVTVPTLLEALRA